MAMYCTRSTDLQCC